MAPTFPSSSRGALLLSMVFKKKIILIIQECESDIGVKLNPAPESIAEKPSHIGKTGRRPGHPHANGDDE